VALFKRGQTRNGVAAASETKAKPTRPHRVLVIGGHGFSADTCVGWGDPRANVTDYDSVLVIPPAEDPGGDTQWRYKEELLQLLLTGATLYVAAVPFVSWPAEGRRAIMPANNYDWCPVPVRVDDRQGESIEAVDKSVEWLFARVRTWSSTVTNYQPGPQPGFQGRENVAVIHEAENLANNRAGEALAMRVRLDLFGVESDGYLHRRLAPDAIGQPSVLLFLSQQVKLLRSKAKVGGGRPSRTSRASRAATPRAAAGPIGGAATFRGSSLPTSGPSTAR
jgi:hypothetical protein